MFCDSWRPRLHQTLQAFRCNTGRKSKRHSLKFRPWVESLVYRITPATIVVNVGSAAA
jgi:hypothetical protein